MSIFRCVWVVFVRITIFFKICTPRQKRHENINTLKATKDIATGQEFFIQYGNAEWFECNDIMYDMLYADNDDASTMWRPDLRPLPCRQTVRHTTGADGRHSFVVHADNIPPGTVVEISLCVEVSVIVVDQFPVLWDFVIIDAATQTVCAPPRMQRSLLTTQCLLMRTYISV